MNPELWLVFVPALSAMLFALGGTQISDKIEGKKWIRRFVLAFLLGLCVFLAKFAIWQSAGVAILSCVMFHQGYGDKVKWWRKILTFIGYGCIPLFIGFSYWSIITTVGCTVMFILSNIKLSSATFVWKICEGVFGALIGISVAFLLSGNGILWFK